MRITIKEIEVRIEETVNTPRYYGARLKDKKLSIYILVIMELKDFIVSFAEQFDETDASEFKAETEFKELEEWSSLIALSIIAMVDEEYGITLVADDIRESDTIEDLFNKVKAKA